jgi:hypothetical protein
MFRISTACLIGMLLLSSQAKAQNSFASDAEVVGREIVRWPLELTNKQNWDVFDGRSPTVSDGSTYGQLLETFKGHVLDLSRWDATHRTSNIQFVTDSGAILLGVGVLAIIGKRWFFTKKFSQHLSLDEAFKKEVLPIREQAKMYLTEDQLEELTKYFDQLMNNSRRPDGSEPAVPESLREFSERSGKSVWNTWRTKIDRYLEFEKCGKGRAKSTGLPLADATVLGTSRRCGSLVSQIPDQPLGNSPK